MLARPLALAVLLAAPALDLTRRLLHAQRRHSILLRVRQSALLAQQVKHAVLRMQLVAPVHQTLLPLSELEPAPRLQSEASLRRSMSQLRPALQVSWLLEAQTSEYVVISALKGRLAPHQPHLERRHALRAKSLLLARQLVQIARRATHVPLPIQATSSPVLMANTATLLWVLACPVQWETTAPILVSSVHALWGPGRLLVPSIVDHALTPTAARLQQWPPVPQTSTSTPPLLPDIRARLVLMALNAWTNTRRPLARRDGYVPHLELVPSALQEASVLMLLPRLRAQRGLSQMREPPPAILAQQELLAVERRQEMGPP